MKKVAIQIMDITTIKAVLKDIRRELIPSRYEKAQQPDSKTIQLGFRTLEGLKWLEISWVADAARIVRIQAPKRTGEKSTLAKQIQHILGNLALSEIKQEGFERVITLAFAKRPGAEIEKKAIIELMGQHSNFLLLDNENKVITLGKQVREFQSRLRPVSTGDLYNPPPSLKGTKPNVCESFSDWKDKLCLIPIPLKKALQDTYQGISPSIALQLVHHEFDIAQKCLNQSVSNLNEETWRNIYSSWKKWLQTIEDENYFLRFDGPTNYSVWGKSTQNTKQDISSMLGMYYKEKIINKEINLIIERISRKLFKAKETEEKSLSRQLNSIKGIDKYKEMQQRAISILSLVSPDKGQIIEAQLLFKKAKKKKRSREYLLKRINYHKQKISNLEDSESLLSSLISINLESDEEKLEKIIELQREINEYHFASKQNKKDNQTKKRNESRITEIKTPNGLIIQIGRNHKQNEMISLRLAKKGDLWFHSQECSGSHVVLKSSSRLIEQNDIQLAADLAAFFSKAKGNKTVPVIMTKTENLQRISGTLPGTVTHKSGKVIWGKVESAMKHIQKQGSSMPYHQKH